MGADGSESMNLSANIFYRGMGLVILGLVLRDVREGPIKEEKKGSDSKSASSSWMMCKVDIEILKGKDLVPKDKNIFG
ncbi:MAG: hypothetical protein SGILL_010453, partial [Bacillariaceae sp.]